jgi:hypothetical protein
MKAIPAEFYFPRGLRPQNLDDRRALPATVASALVIVMKLTEHYAQHYLAELLLVSRGIPG